MKKAQSHADVFALAIILCVAAFAAASQAPSATPTDDERRADRRARILQAIEEQRSRPPIPADGAIIQPGESVRVPDNEDTEMVVVFDGEPARSVAHIYASVTGKEILVSSRVGRRPIKMDRIIGNSEHIRQKLEEVLTAHGIKIVEAGDYSIAFVD